jgi:hypothetical protein
VPIREGPCTVGVFTHQPMPLSVNNTFVRCQLKPMSCAQLISSTTMLYHDVHRCLPHSLCCICNVSQGHRHNTAWLGLANVLLEIEIPTESPARTPCEIRLETQNARAQAGTNTRVQTLKQQQTHFRNAALSLDEASPMQ